MLRSDLRPEFLFLGAALGTALGALLLGIPALIRKRAPEKYKGFWRLVGDFFPTISLKQLGGTVFGSLLGLALLATIRYAYPQVWQILIKPPISYLASASTIIFLIIALGIGVRKWLKPGRWSSK